MTAEALTRIKEVLGDKGWIDDPAEVEPHLVERRGLYRGATALVARPASTGEVAQIVRICAEASLPIVPQGGNTGLVGGGVPAEDGRNIVLSLARMNRVRALDPVNFTITVEAGCILADIQKAAAEADRLFPLSLGAEGSCQIGGNLSTNAGGVAVLHYGNTRDLTLGLEVVLPDGRVWNGLRGLRKDNTGYDLKHLFIGAEGTLGIVTAATLKLFPRPRQKETAFLALPRAEDAMTVLVRLRAACGDQLTAFELIPRLGLEFGMRHMEGVHDPFAHPHPWYTLLDMSSGSERSGLLEVLEQTLQECMDDGLVSDAAIAQSATQAKAFWRIREGEVEGQLHEGGSIKHDVSVPVSLVADFITMATAAVESVLPGIRVMAFGHVGDGNIHFNLSQPIGADRAAFLARWGEFSRIVHDIVDSLGGSISAEHGIGRLKPAELARYKSPLELELMRRIKTALDPEGIMNPGKILISPPVSGKISGGSRS